MAKPTEFIVINISTTVTIFTSIFPAKFTSIIKSDYS